MNDHEKQDDTKSFKQLLYITIATIVICLAIPITPYSKFLSEIFIDHILLPLAILLMVFESLFFNSWTWNLMLSLIPITLAFTYVRYFS